MTKFQKFLVPGYFECILLIKIQLKGSTVILPSKFFFCSVITLDDLCLAVNSEGNFSYLHSMFSHGLKLC